MPSSHANLFYTTTTMSITHSTKTQSTNDEEELSDEFKELLLSLPKERGWRTSHIYLYQEFWCQPKEIQAIINFQQHFQARDSDLILVTMPKSGTTWLKAMAFAVLNRKSFSISKNHPLLTSNPHDLVPFLEYKLYANNQLPDLSMLPQPRLLATHVPFSSLPASIKNSDCRIVYWCRNPLDTFVSSWHFLMKVRPETLGPISIEEGFEMYCRGAMAFGPFWKHMLEYWNESLEPPNKMLFMKYEDTKEDPVFQLKRLANFLGVPFSFEEEREGVAEEISRLCSFENLKNLEVNQTGRSIGYFENKNLFRKGVLGDWVNHLTPSMADQIFQIMKGKLAGSGLEFKVF